MDQQPDWKKEFAATPRNSRMSRSRMLPVCSNIPLQTNTSFQTLHDIWLFKQTIECIKIHDICQLIYKAFTVFCHFTCIALPCSRLLLLRLHSS